MEKRMQIRNKFNAVASSVIHVKLVRPKSNHYNAGQGSRITLIVAI